jgi:Transposase zinc-binding domain
MSACRTAALGAHVARCQDCAYTTIAYNSCRNHLFRRLFLDRLTAAHKQLQFFGNHTPLADAQAFAAYAGCCARAASGHAAAPPSAASNFRRPMVTVIRPSPCEVR